MPRSLASTIVLLSMVGTAVTTGASDEPPGARKTSSSNAPVDAASGHGEMVILGDDRNFITRAYRDEAGNIVIQCTQDPPIRTAPE